MEQNIQSATSKPAAISDGFRVAAMMGLCDGLPVSRALYLLETAAAYLKHAASVDSNASAFRAAVQELRSASDEAV